MRRVWCIGEAPSRATSRPGGAPLVGESGRRLAEWAGLGRAEMRRRCRMTNLFDERPARWDRRMAAERANRLLLRGWGEQLLLVVGVRVRDAVFGEAWGAELEPFTVYDLCGAGCLYAWMPHPSGCNRFWNEPANVRRAERFLRRIFDTAPAPRQPRLAGTRRAG